MPELNNIIKYDIRLLGSDTTYDFTEEQLNAYFNLPYAHTCHSMQGATVNSGLTVAEVNFSCNTYNGESFKPITKEWYYTASSRLRKFSNLSYLLMDVNYDQLVMNYAYSKVQGYKKQDALAGREYNYKEYINPYWILKQYKNQKAVCKHCKQFFNVLPDGTREGYTIDRKNNLIAHTKENCFISHLGCNASAQ